MMSLHKLTAGDGYTYLTRQVAAADSSELGRTSLADYYTEKGERPGLWFGNGLAGVGGVAAGDTVTEAHMRALFGEGRHPHADELERSVVARGGTVKDAMAATALGMRFAQYDTTPSPFIIETTRLYQAWNRDHGQPRGAAVPAGERARLRSRAAWETFVEQYGRDPLNDRELAGHIARSSRPPRQAVAGYDLTFSPVKSVSTLWALADRDTARQIEAAHEAAVRDTIAWIEREVAYTRTGPQGVRQVDVTGLIGTAFTHRDSRAGDPDLHTHVAISNKVQALDGKWLALDGAVLHRAAVAASERYNTRLEAEVAGRLDVTFTTAPRKTRDGKRVVREVRGVSATLMETWSTRRAAIDARRAALATQFQFDQGRPPTPKETIELAQQATLETRDVKHDPRSLAEQRATWRQQADRALGAREAVDTMLAEVLHSAARRTGPATDDSLSNAAVIDLAARALFTVQMSRARFQWAHVYAEASRLVRHLNLPAAHLDQSIDAVVTSALTHTGTVAIIPSDGTVLVRLGSPEQTREATDGLPIEPAVLRRRDGQGVYTPAKSQLYTTASMLDAEAYLITMAQRTGGRVVDDATLGAALLESTANGVTLNPGQVQLVSEMATSGARLQLALAPAGSGKTTAMTVLTRAWTDSGGQVIGLAPSAAAAKELADATGVRADTLAKLTHSLRTTAGDDNEAPDWVQQIGPNTLVIIDEAGMAGTLELATTVRYVTARGGSVRLIGDEQQLAAIGAGGVLRDIAEEVGAVTLTELMRFSDPAEGAATLALRAGDTEALGFYLDRGRVHVADETTVSDVAYAAWAADTAAGKTSLMLAFANDVVTSLNARARADRLATSGAAATPAVPPPITAQDRIDTHDATPSAASAAVVTAPQGNGPEVQLASGLAASVGDLIVTRRNDRRLPLTATDWVKNGDRFTVTAVHPGGHLTVQHLATARTVTLPADYVAQHVDLGYACTFHGAQGATVDTCHSALSGAESRQLLYVGMTRGRHENHAYIATAGDGDDHGVIRPDRIAPPTAAEALTSIVTTDGSQRSAHTETRHHLAPATRLALTAPRYVDALGVAATTVIGGDGMKQLDRRAEAALPGLTAQPAWDTLRGTLALIALHATRTETPGVPSEAGITPTNAPTLNPHQLQTALERVSADLVAAVAQRELDTALDPAAVLHWRITDAHPISAGPLPWLPGIPSRLAQDPEWGPYLAHRATLVSSFADAVRDAAARMTSETAPGWARPLLEDRPLLGEVMVWRAATGVDDGNDGGRLLGGPHPAVAARAHQDGLAARLGPALSGAADGSLDTELEQGWREIVNAHEPRVMDDPHWPVIHRRLRLAAAGGLDVAALLTDAVGAAPLPDEHPAAALWYRLVPALSPAAALTAATGSGATRLRPPWCALLTDTLPDNLGAAVMADPYWPAVVAAVHAASTRGNPPERAIPDAVALLHPDLIGQPGGVPVSDLAVVLSWRLSDLTDHHPGSHGRTDPSRADIIEGPSSAHEHEMLDDELEQFLTHLHQSDQSPQVPETDPKHTDDERSSAAVSLPPSTTDTEPADGPWPDHPDVVDVELPAGDEGPRVATARERIVELNIAALRYYRQQLTGSPAEAYMYERFAVATAEPADGAGVSDEVSATSADREADANGGMTPFGSFAIGYAPGGWTSLVDHLRSDQQLRPTDDELIDAGLARYARRGALIDLFRDRLMFAIHEPTPATGSGRTGRTEPHDERAAHPTPGAVVGFVGRSAPHAPAPVPKYINTPETPAFHKGQLLFGAAETADLLAAGAVPVRVEGPMDAVAVTLAGHGEVVGLAPLGTALTDSQADQLAALAQHGGRPVVVATDNDPAGRKAAEKDYWKLVHRGADPRTLSLPEGTDPADLYRKDRSRLAALLRDHDDCPSLAATLIDARIAAWSADLSHQWVHARIGAARSCAPVIAALPLELWDEHIARTAERIGEDRPLTMVYTEVIAAAVNYDLAQDSAAPVVEITTGAQLSDLAARLAQRHADLETRRARSDAFNVVADALRFHQDGAKADTGRRKPPDQPRPTRDPRHEPRPDGPAPTQGPSMR